MSPTVRLEMVARRWEQYKLSERRASRLVGQNRSVQRYRSHKAEVEGLEEALAEQAREQLGFG